MNRKQRRAANRRAQAAQARRPLVSADETAAVLFAEAVRCQQQNRFDEAARIYSRLFATKPDHAQARNNFGLALLAQGKLREASAQFAQSLSLLPQLFEQFGAVYQTLEMVLPALARAVQRAGADWPARPSINEMLGSGGLRAICDDPMLLCMLQSVPVRKIGLERALTSIRAGMLAQPDDADDVLAFRCALAKQCFINEYVFSTTPDEDARVSQLKAAMAAGEIKPAAIATLAMYEPLHAPPEAKALLERKWPPALDDLITQQVREPQQELQSRPTIPVLTPIEDATSQRVRQQYEENPYPRWVNFAHNVTPMTLDEQLRLWFPTAAFEPLGKTDSIDILVAGCGTGLQAAEVTQGYVGARTLAVDLSLASLCYAKRKTRPPLAERVEYVQGDILKLGGISRTFDLIASAGVLHHMADPLEGWRVLLSLLRPGGFMHLGLYSEIARRDVVAARAFIAERGYASTTADIRHCRQDLMNTPLRTIDRLNDFFTTSECRDLLFHVQESRMTIPAIKEFIAGQGLKFIGFNFDEANAANYRSQFAANAWSMADLDKWQAVETQNPDTFLGMYQFWVQKPAGA
jgi:SAM-dependent methyltransferase/tetratricopeptide (TPR) repeat protein